MKKLIDNLAVVTVVLLFGVVIALVVRYNMIDEGSTEALVVVPETDEPVEKKKEPKAYLQSLESYGEDVDVEVDPTKESQKNTVKVISELAEDDLESALQSDTKGSYVKSLENYSEKKKPVVKQEKLEDVKPEKEKNNDTIGDELDSILGE